MTRKPKGWSHRYEIYWHDVEHNWHVIHALGRTHSYGLIKTVKAPIDISTSDLLRRADADNVTVPVVIKRETGDEIVLGKYYGMK